MRAAFVMAVRAWKRVPAAPVKRFRASLVKIRLPKFVRGVFFELRA